jgi:hypothetical protein
MVRFVLDPLLSLRPSARLTMWDEREALIRWTYWSLVQ